jgi:5-methylcytosine-specific restriction endonuclease McrA
MEATLMLSSTYEPLRVISWKRAIRLLWLGKVEVLEEYDEEIRSISISIRMPAVVRLLRFFRYKRQPVRFSRQNVYARDRHTCQYCGTRLPPSELTFDHVVPKVLGGKTEWDNIVSCCIPCNMRKRGKTPAEAGMKLIKKPRRPKWIPTLTLKINFRSAPQSWRDYLYWNLEIEA